MCSREPHYASLHQIDILKKEKNESHKKVILLYPLIIVFIFFLEYKWAIKISLVFNISVFCMKFLADKISGIQMAFLPPFDLNKINISQEKKQEAINYKVTNFEETDPIRIMEESSGKKYLLYNTSNSYLKYI